MYCNQLLPFCEPVHFQVIRTSTLSKDELLKFKEMEYTDWTLDLQASARCVLDVQTSLQFH